MIHVPEETIRKYSRGFNLTSCRFLSSVYDTGGATPSTYDDSIRIRRCDSIISFVTLQQYINISRSLGRKFKVVIRFDVVTFKELLTFLIRRRLIVVGILNYSSICCKRRS